jgi:hypothetical protein
MNTAAVEKIADAVLYEGYILYPYRPSSVKNRQRFNFGVLYPRAYCDSQAVSEWWEMRTECLIAGPASSSVQVKVRFLQMSSRWQLGQVWHEGRERDSSISAQALEVIAARTRREHVTLPGAADVERMSRCIDAELELAALQLEENLYRLSLGIRNLTKPDDPGCMDRDEMLLHSMVSVHSILEVTGGEFVSLLDPPEALRSAAFECRNSGTWPVLAGDQSQRNLVLSAPIILYDYPQIAPESPGDLFDGTEIDEILALRILTMTDAEKLEVRNCDDRARRILDRTEMLPPEHFQKLHGALRGLRPVSEIRDDVSGDSK